jgi:hypothetical protein
LRTTDDPTRLPVTMPSRMSGGRRSASEQLKRRDRRVKNG